MIVDLSGAQEITNDIKASITMRFRSIRTAAQSNPHLASSSLANPSMYLVSSCDKMNNYIPSISSKAPERVVLKMIVNAARTSVTQLKQWMESPHSIDEPVDIFTSDTILSKCQLVLSFHKSISCMDVDKGPQCARLQTYSNVTNKELLVSNLLVM